MTARWAILTGALVLAIAGSASSHSLLLESSPGAGSVLTGTPRELSLRFNNRIEKKLSTIRYATSRRGAPRHGAGRRRPADWVTATVDALPPGACASSGASLDGRPRRERELLLPCRALGAPTCRAAARGMETR